MKPYYERDGIRLYNGDARLILPTLERVDAAIVDPPTGETNFAWDAKIVGWTKLLPTDTFWCFGSLKFFMYERKEFAGWTLAQDIVWRKHNGSNFHADRFRRIHEHAVQFYRGRWSAIYKQPVTTLDAVPKAVRRKRRPTHTGFIAGGPAYVSTDGGPRLQRSVIDVPSTHGYARYATQKPLDILTPLLMYSVPPGGIVLDPFAGSGSLLVAAKRLGLKAIGIDASPEACDIAANWLEETHVN